MVVNNMYKWRRIVLLEKNKCEKVKLLSVSVKVSLYVYNVLFMSWLTSDR